MVDPELSQDRFRFGDNSGYFLNYSSQGAGHTPDTSFYQWVPFILILQVVRTLSSENISEDYH